MSRKERAAIAEAERVSRIEASNEQDRILRAKANDLGFDMWTWQITCRTCGSYVDEYTMQLHRDWHNTEAIS